MVVASTNGSPWVVKRLTGKIEEAEGTLLNKSDHKAHQRLEGIAGLVASSF
jgi:hypothetical protein